MFEYVACTHIPKEKMMKLEMKNRYFIFLGYDEHSKGYKLYNVIKREMLLSRDVIFIEKTTKPKYWLKVIFDVKDEVTPTMYVGRIPQV